MNKFMKKVDEISEEYNNLTYEERLKISRYRDSQRLLDFEQLKTVLIRNHKRTLAEINSWENNILEWLERNEK